MAEEYELFMCYIRRSESTSIFGPNDVICRVIRRHLSFLPYQFSIFDDVGGCDSPGKGASEGHLLASKLPVNAYG